MYGIIADPPSRPSRARGLKRMFGEKKYDHREVAPLAGAWIETAASMPIANAPIASRPSRARGLKRVDRVQDARR